MFYIPYMHFILCTTTSKAFLSPIFLFININGIIETSVHTNTHPLTHTPHGNYGILQFTLNLLFFKF